MKPCKSCEVTSILLSNVQDVHKNIFTTSEKERKVHKNNKIHHGHEEDTFPYKKGGNEYRTG